MTVMTAADLSRARRYLGIGAAAVLAAAVFAAAPAGAATTGPGVFESVATRYDDLAPFPRVGEALRRSFEEMRVQRRECPATRDDCSVARWARFLDGLEGKARHEQLEAVNRFVNRAPYVSDRRNYGVSNLWATAGQLFARGGDCEDYVVAKYVSLRALGFAVSDLRIVVLHDTAMRAAHAVLVAYVGGQAWVLDNQSRHVRRDDRIRYYRPIYSINEDAWWLHRRR